MSTERSPQLGGQPTDDAPGLSSEWGKYRQREVIWVLSQDEPHRHLLSLMLERGGYEVVASDDPLVCLAEAPPPDTILVGGSWPGLMWCEHELRPALPEVRIILITGRADLLYLEYAYQVGFNDVLLSPVMMNDLLDHLRS